MRSITKTGGRLLLSVDPAAGPLRGATALHATWRCDTPSFYLDEARLYTRVTRTYRSAGRTASVAVADDAASGAGGAALRVGDRDTLEAPLPASSLANPAGLRAALDGRRPAVHTGLDVSVRVVLDDSAWAGPPPAGFAAGDLVNIQVDAALEIWGEALR